MPSTKATSHTKEFLEAMFQDDTPKALALVKHPRVQVNRYHRFACEPAILMAATRDNLQIFQRLLDHPGLYIDPHSQGLLLDRIWVQDQTEFLRVWMDHPRFQIHHDTNMDSWWYWHYRHMGDETQQSERWIMFKMLMQRVLDTNHLNRLRYLTLHPAESTTNILARLRHDSGLSLPMAAELLALLVLVSDGHLRVFNGDHYHYHPSRTPECRRFYKFLRLCCELPLEIQGLICLRAFGFPHKDIIPTAQLETAFRKHAKFFLSPFCQALCKTPFFIPIDIK